MYQDSRRKTITAVGTLERPTAGLDAYSLVAVDWVTAWASTRGRLKPQPAVIMRRALGLLVEHLSHLDAEEDEEKRDEATQRELLALHRAAKGSGSARTLTECRARLEAAEGRKVSFIEVLHSPEARQATAAVNAAMEAGGLA
jgi:hypothetical protein